MRPLHVFTKYPLCIEQRQLNQVLGSIVVSIPACHAGDRGSIPRRGGHFFFKSTTFKDH